MDDVEDASSPRVRDVRSSRTIGDVHDEDLTSDVHLTKIEARSGFIRESLIVRIECLFSRQLFEVDSVVVDGCDDGDQVFELILRKGSI